MAKATIVGNAVVITSAAKFSDIEKIAKYRPNALILKGGDDGKEDIFRVGVSNNGSINQYGIEFDDVSKNGEGLACVTFCLHTSADDPRAFVANRYGSALAALNKIEGTWADVLADIDAEIGAVMESIEVL